MRGGNIFHFYYNMGGGGVERTRCAHQKYTIKESVKLLIGIDTDENLKDDKFQD